jgi:divalent metal cation (Fe/Co/Zn/Cd) transporter
LATPGVDALNRLAAIHAGAEQVRVDVDLDLAEELDTLQIERILDDVEDRARSVLPEIGSLHVALNSPPD